MKETTEGQTEIITSPDSVPQAPFDLRIRFDAAHRVIAISLNDEPLNLTAPAQAIEPPLGHPHAAGPAAVVNSNSDPAICLERRD
jgi:hypothetical protein